MEGEEGEVQMANYSPAWRAHAAGARLVQCLQGLGRGRGLDALAHEAGPKAVQEPKHRGGDKQQQPKKKKKEKKKKKQRARKLGAQCPNLANQCGRAGVGGWGSFAPSCLSHRRQEKEQENKKKAWDAPKKLHVQAELGET